MKPIKTKQLGEFWIANQGETSAIGATEEAAIEGVRDCAGTQKERDRVLRIAHQRKEFFLDVDGFVYFWPEKNIGHLSSNQLRWLADELDRINAPWEKQIEEELAI
jgi:hypothetical protein